MIASWYVPEASSAAAHAARARFRPPSALTHLHLLELSNAWQLKVFRGELGADAAARAQDRLQSDVDSGLWLVPDQDLAAAFAAAARLAREHTAGLGNRSLDVLHVALALALEERYFVTGDARQAKLATAVGLQVTRV